MTASPIYFWNLNTTGATFKFYDTNKIMAYFEGFLRKDLEKHKTIEIMGTFNITPDEFDAVIEICDQIIQNKHDWIFPEKLNHVVTLLECTFTNISQDDAGVLKMCDVPAFAAKKGNIYLLKLLNELGLLSNANSNIGLYASNSGHLNCLEYYYNIGGSLNPAMAGNAACGGHADCLRFLLENKCPTNGFLLSDAMMNGTNIGCLNLIRHFINSGLIYVEYSAFHNHTIHLYVKNKKYAGDLNVLNAQMAMKTWDAYNKLNNAKSDKDVFDVYSSIMEDN